MPNKAIQRASLDLDNTVEAIRDHLRARPRTQTAEYELAFLASEAAVLRHLVSSAGTNSDINPHLRVAAGYLLRSAISRLSTPGLGVDPGGLDEHRPIMMDSQAEEATEGVMGVETPRLLDEDLQLLATTYFDFGQQIISPHANAVHRGDLDIPEEIIMGLARLGAFGMSVPGDYGGSAHLGGSLPMIIATEQLSRASLAIGGSLLTRPEILVRAIVDGGTSEQKKRWLPAIADGRAMIGVAVTEPDYGSNVAGIRTSARRDGDYWILSGTKMWATFAGRAEFLMVLARTNPDLSVGHGGLSLFVVEKPAQPGHAFSLDQPGGGAMRGRAIRTVGYRGLHTFELAFEEWAVPAANLIGMDDGLGRGFHLQMGAFAGGRLQTAARAVGLMQASIDAATTYASDRQVFDKPLIEHQLTRSRLAEMMSKTVAYRLYSHHVAGLLDTGRGDLEASMIKAVSCRAAEEISRTAMQIHGGYGYAEEYDIARIWQDARVLSIFEGTEEVLATRVIAKRLLDR